MFSFCRLSASLRSDGQYTSPSLLRWLCLRCLSSQWHGLRWRRKWPSSLHLSWWPACSTSWCVAIECTTNLRFRGRMSSISRKANFCYELATEVSRSPVSGGGTKLCMRNFLLELVQVVFCAERTVPCTYRYMFKFT